MYINDISRQQFSKIASRRFQGRMTFRARARSWRRYLARETGRQSPSERGGTRADLDASFGRLRARGADCGLGIAAPRGKTLHGGDKCLAAIHLAQMGLPDIGEDAAYRLALAAKLIDAGLAPRELARELGFDPPAGLIKYDPDQPRVPAGSGKESGQWTPSGDTTSGDTASGDASGSPLIEGRSAGTGRGAGSRKLNHVHGVPKDAIVVTRPDGTAIDDPYSTGGKLMAPPRANFREVYAEGTTKPNVFQIDEDIGHFGRFDYQRDKASNTFYSAYKHASNYAVGVLMAGAGYTREETRDRSETFAYLFSDNYETD